jgi:hypothetical protein
MLTSRLYISPVKKVRACQPTEDLIFAHADRPNFGLALWVVYDAVKADWIIIAVNLAGSLTGFVIYHKLRERDRSRGQVAPDRA